MSDSAKLIYASSETDADQLYITRFFSPDPFLMVEIGGQTTVLLSPLEVDRGKKDAKVDTVLSTEPYRLRLMERNEGKEPTGTELLVEFLKELDVKEFTVPGSFPLGLSRTLEAEGFTLNPEEGSLYPQRQFKTEVEVDLMRDVLRITETAVERGIAILRESTVGEDGVLLWEEEVLTSERLRFEIDLVALRLGAAPYNTIVAGGEQSCDPHERGSGPLRANELIVIDFFPRHVGTGYYGDLTRTVIKGQASAAHRALWDMVLEGQELALTLLQPGADGEAVQKRIKEYFTEHGYPTEEKDGRWGGFFHGLGHGLGLELHEHPRISRTTLTPGQIVTVEPGLYYSGLGGVRHEDVILIRETGPELLTSTPKPFEI